VTAWRWTCTSSSSGTDLRIHDGEQRRRLIGSVAEIGQQVPVVVIRDADRLVLIRTASCT
jgi:hypothetical protein